VGEGCGLLSRNTTQTMRMAKRQGLMMMRKFPFQRRMQAEDVDVMANMVVSMVRDIVMALIDMVLMDLMMKMRRLLVIGATAAAMEVTSSLPAGDHNMAEAKAEPKTAKQPMTKEVRIQRRGDEEDEEELAPKEAKDMAEAEATQDTEDKDSHIPRSFQRHADTSKMLNRIHKAKCVKSKGERTTSEISRSGGARRPC